MRRFRRCFKYFCEGGPGAPPWRPLLVSATDDTMYADLQAVKKESLPTPEELAL
ncbi:MAG: hypothetical protein AVDCRST_MAG14-1140 [uncultured Rubrobacteraceae bacterium]|uniref:Uncharacterized protein n=1 Tax=uncultured Rubrobacteraceae bacterium TaxID=349277 RepID=A0A6J4QRA6_9ACTN|nr:MAG: hypothetical protein AVDCRST_MAG14-1140 [uncultured Rubrobacteraceae bacterium]